MPWGEKSTSDLNNKLIAAIDDHVQHKSVDFTTQIQELSSILETLANLLQSDRIDRKRKEDPNIPGNWSVKDWKHFWEGYDPRWSPITIEIPANHPLLLNLQMENQKLGEKIEALEKQVKHSEEVQQSLAQQLRYYQIEEKKAQKKQLTKKEAAIPDRYRDIVLQARFLPEKMPGDEYKDTLLYAPQRWPRKYRILYVIAHTGWATRLELEHVLGLIEDVSPKNGSIKRILGELLIPNFLEQAIVSFTKDGKTTSLVIVRLAIDGSSLCKYFGWDVTESEWESLQSEAKFREKLSQLQALNVIRRKKS